MSLKFYRFDVNIQIDSCRIQRNFNADATVLPAKPKEKEPALSVCKLFSLCRSGCSALGFSFSRSGSDSAVPAPQTAHRPQAQSRETPSFPSRFSRSDANGLCNRRNDVCNTIIAQQKRSRPLSLAKRTAPEMQCRKSDRNGVADVDQDGVQCLRQKSPVVKYRSSSSYFAHLSITTPFPFYIFIRRYAFACFSAKKFLFNHQWRNAAAQKIKVPATFAHSSHSEP